MWTKQHSPVVVQRQTATALVLRANFQDNPGNKSVSECQTNLNFVGMTTVTLGLAELQSNHYRQHTNT